MSLTTVRFDVWWKFCRVWLRIGYDAAMAWKVPYGSPGWSRPHNRELSDSMFPPRIEMDAT